MLRRLALLVVALGLPIVLVGCGEAPPEFGDVEGVVLVNGKPLSRLVVTFMPEPAAGGKEIPVTATAETDEQGKYQLKHFYKGQEGVGAPVGMNRVLVEDLRQSHLGQGQQRPPRLIAVEYSNPTSTTLRKEVKPGPQTIDLELN